MSPPGEQREPFLPQLNLYIFAAQKWVETLLDPYKLAVNKYTDTQTHKHTNNKNFR